MLSNSDLHHKSEKPSVELLENLWQHGVESVRGRESVKRYFAVHEKKNADYTVVAIGKAATDMMLGAVDVLGSSLKSGLVLTKTDHLSDELTRHSHIISHESSHPVPDESSLEAGRILLDYISSIPQEHKVLALISGGASSLVEVLIEDCSLDDLQRLSEWGLQGGLNINEINYMRQKISLIKGGKLCNYFNQNEVLCLYISDVPEDNMNVIGSGLLYSDQEMSELISPKMKSRIDNFLKGIISSLGQEQNLKPKQSLATFEHHMIANNAIAKEAVKQYASELGYTAYVSNDSIDMDYRDTANMIMEKLRVAEPGVYIWGGEPTVELPEAPGNGGRNQALALLLGVQLKDFTHISLLVGGTDGTDGPTDAAGGVVDGQTYHNAINLGFEPEKVLKEANSYPCLKAVGSLFSPGPTGTNVMDLVIAIVEPKH
ncbi:MAG: glycerate kinase type-2 family protein [Cellvibrionaceae bacterium]